MKIIKLSLILLLSVITVLGSEYWQNYVHYKIDVKLDDDNHFLHGKEIITYYNNSSDSLEKIHLLLYPNAYKNNETHFAQQQKRFEKTKFLNSKEDDKGYIEIDSLVVDNVSGEIIIPEDSISTGYVNLSKLLLPGDSVKIFIKWSVKIPLSFSRMCHSGQKYYITQWFPKIPVYDKNGWHPYPYLTIGEFYYEFGDYDVNITLPSNYVVAATGTLIAPSTEHEFLDSLAIIGSAVMNMSKKEYITWKGSNKNPISSETEKTLTYKAKNVVDFAWTASKEHLVQKSFYSYENSSDLIGIWNYFLPENRRAWENAINITKSTLKSYGKLCGPYPYPNVVTVDGDLTAGGGMEYPMLTIINSSNMQLQMWQVIGHEVGHNWFYGILGFNEREKAWMDEGLNTFGEMRFLEEEFPDSLSPLNMLPFSDTFKKMLDNLNFQNVYQIFLAMAKASDNIQPGDLNGYLYTSGMSYNASVYIKPAMGFRLLEQYVGREKFDKAMNEFYEQWKFCHPQPEDMQMSFEKSLDMDLNWLFQDFLKKIDLPDYKISKFTVKDIDNQYQTIIDVENLGETIQPFPIVLYKDGKELLKEWIANVQKSKTITFTTKEKPDQAIIDPELSTIETNYYNNYSKKFPPVDANFIFNLPAPNKYLINYIPYLSYNYYEGLKLGGGLYHLSITPPKNTYVTYGNYSLKNNNVNGAFRYITKFNGEKINSKITSNFSHNLLKDKIGSTISWESNNKKKYENSVSVYANYLKIKNKDFLDNSYWETGKYISLHLENNFSKDLNKLKFNNKIGIKYNHNLDNAANYLKLYGCITSSKLLQSKIINNLKINNRIYFGSFLGKSDNIPSHLRFYGNGGVDPDFEEAYIYDRSGETSFSPMNNYFISDGINLKGYQKMIDKNGIYGGDKWALGYNLEISKKLFFLFFDVGDVVSNDENFSMNWDAGFGLNFFIFRFHFPMYVSNPYDDFDKLSNWKAIKQRYVISLRFSKIQLGL